MNPGIGAQPHHIDPARASLKPAEQLSTGKGSIRQHGDRAELREQAVGLLQQGNHHLSADAGKGMLKRLPEQRDRSAVADHGEDYDTETVPEHRGVERQVQGLAWVLPLLHRPEHQRAVEALGIDPPIAEPTPEGCGSVKSSKGASRGFVTQLKHLRKMLKTIMSLTLD